MRNLFFVLVGILFASNSILFSQTGPAGVGNQSGENGQPENIIWLDASDLTSFVDGDTWDDKSGNSNNAIFTSKGGNLPSIESYNSQNYLAFDGTGYYLQILDDDSGNNRLDGMDELAIFTVFNPGNTDTRCLISKRLNASNRSWSLFHNNGYEMNGYAGTGSAGGGLNISGSYGIGSYILNNSLSLYYNGDLQVSNGSAYSIPDRSENITIGRFDESASETRWYNGSIAEIIVYREGINTAQQIIIENYLSQKYGIALATSANDKFTPTDLSFVENIAGVGAESDGTHSLASSSGLYIALRDSSDGDYLMAAHDGTINDIASIQSVSVADVAWNRSWYIEKTGSSSVRLSFDLSEGIGGQYPQDITNYVLLRKDTPTGTYSLVTTSLKGVEEGDRIYFEIEDGDFSSGFFTLGTLDETESPVEGGERRIWYALRSTADWDSPDAWTLEPCGCLPNNPEGLTPITSPTSASDKVVISSGKKITVPTGVNNLANGELVVNGELDLQTTTGHTFSSISGSGLIAMAKDNFPDGDASDFVSEGEGEGKIRYYGSGYTIATDQEFFDMEVDLTSNTSEIIITANLLINGDFQIENGIVILNDDSSTDNIIVDVMGDFNIDSDGQFITGEGNARHQLNLYGDFINQGGVAKFTNRTTASFNSDATDGIVDVNFLNDIKDQLVTCNGVTNFYRIEIDKGDDQTYIVSINASNTDNFKLLGRANYSHSSISQLTSNSNALGLLKGTVRIGQNVLVDQLNTTGNYNISDAACLWVDGGTVSKSSGTAIVPYGTLKVTSGTLSALVNSGITLRDNGIIQVDGGILNTNQIRTSVLGDQHQGGYIQSGGVVNVLGGSTNTDYYVFNLTYEGNTFQMTGGELNVEQANSNGGIFINSLPANYNVTGGTVVANIGNSYDFVITSRAPFYNLILEKNVSNSNVYILDNGIDVGSTDVDLQAQPLKVLNDFRVRGEESSTDYPDITLQAVNSDSEPVDIYIGGSMFLENGVQYVFGIGGVSPYDNSSKQPTQVNTIYFNQTIATSAVDTLYWGHDGGGDNDIDNTERCEIGNFELDRNTGNELRTVAASNIKNNQIFIDVNGDASVLSGTLDQGRQVFRTWGKIINYDRMGTWYENGSYPIAGGTPGAAQIRFREDAAVEIETIDGAVFGNIRFNVNPNTTHVTLTSDVKIERMEYTRGAIYLKGYNLTIDRMWNLQSNGDLYTDIANSEELNVSESGVDGNKLIYTDGKASDGGLSLYVDEDTRDETQNNRDKNFSPLTFPIGYTTDEGNTVYHRPAQMKVTNFQDDGYVTIRPVVGELETTDPTGGKEILPMYWRVTHSDFTDLPTVAFQFYYTEGDVSAASQEDKYVPGYVLDELPFSRVYQDGKTDVVNAEVGGATRRIVFNGTSTGGEFDKDVFEGFTLINANFTCGESQRFNGTPEIYYNRRINNDPWADKNSWYDDAEGTKNSTDYPQAGDIAVIRGSNWTHNITVGGTQTCAQIIFQREGTYSDIESLPRLRVGTSDVLTVGLITGVGDLYLQRNLSTSGNVIGDIGDFASNDTSVVEFYTTANGLYSVDEDDFLNDLPTLRIYGAGNTNRKVQFNYDLNCKNLVVDGRATLIVGGNYEIENQTRLGFTYDGRIQFTNGTEAYSLTTKDLYSSTGKGTEAEEYTIDVESGGSNSIEHELIVKGNVNLNFRGTVNASDYFTFDLYNSPTENNVILSIEGDESAEFNNAFADGQFSIDLYKIDMNKGENVDSTFTINTAFNLDAPSDGDTKNIILQNGLLRLNNSDIAIDLSTGGEYFEIAGTSGLEIEQGSTYVNGESGILLDGLLKISGGTLDMSDSDSGEEDNPILYSTSGNAEINITSGTLKVGSQIRRSENDDLGVLKYEQTGGDVLIGVSSGGIASRGMFEILNEGSALTITGGTFTIVQQNSSSPSISSLLLEPTSYNLSGSTINVFNDDTPTGQTDFGINSSIPLNNIVINGTNNPIVNLKIKDLSIGGNLDIESGATLDSKGFNIEIQGNWTNLGTFNASSNEVLFTGYNAQTITGSTTFYKFTKQSGGDVLSLGSSTDITVEYLLTLTDGSINDNGNEIFVSRDIDNEGEIISGDGDGVVLNGTASQRLYGNGTYEKMYLDNSSGFTQEEGNEITIKENLQMESGVLDIGKNLIVFEENATINTTTGFSVSNMIQTNISFVDAGIKKYVPIGTLTFIYPLGSGGAYTPVNLSVTNNSVSGAYLRVKGANECHPSIIDLTSTTMDETTNVLQYYWILDANGFTDFQGSVSMSYPNSLVEVTESGYTYDDYITARLLSRGSGEWNKDIGTIDTSNDIITFDFSVATDDDGIIGDYTAGLDEAIPDQVPTYTSVNDGNWNDVSIWSPTPPAGGPRGAIVVVNNNVTIPVDYISSYKTAVNEMLLIPGTEGHRLGNVTGTGTLYLETGGLPAGDYSEFFIADGGTVEFSGTEESYPVLSGITTVNNLKFSGTGERDLPNTDLNILGDLTIESSGTLQVNNTNDKNLNIKGDIEYNSGTVDFGSGTMVLNGTGLQYIQGTASFIGTSELFNLNINNGNGVNLQTDADVSNMLKLTNGILNTENADLVITNSESDAFQGGSSTSFVEGPLSKYINYNESFQFPIGCGGRYGVIKLYNAKKNGTSGTGLWKAEYFNSDPNSNGYDTNSKDGDLQYVSQNEYWTINGPDGATSRLTMTWDDQSGVSPDNNFRLVQWKDLSTSAWQEIEITDLDGDASEGTVSSSIALNFNEFTEGSTFTFGSILIPAYTWIGSSNDWFSASNWSNTVVPTASSDVTINTISTPYVYPVIDPLVKGDVVQVNDLTIASGANLTLYEGSRFTINGDLETNGGLVVYNSVDNPSSIITHGEVSGETNYEWTGIDTHVWWQISHPLQGVSQSDYTDSFGADRFAVNRYLASGWERVAGINNVYSDNYDFDSDALEGYSILAADLTTLSYAGTLNHEDSYSSSNMSARWYLVANPYPCYIDVKDAGFDLGSFAKTIYIRKSDNEVSTYNILTGYGLLEGSRYISPGQSIWIRTYKSTNDDAIAIANSVRTHTTGGYGLKSSTTQYDENLNLQIESSNGLDETIVLFNEDGSELETEYDSEKLLNKGNLVNIYSIKEEKSIAINSLPELTAERVIPLGYSVSSEGMSDFTITTSNIESFLPDVDVYLVDKVEGVTINLRESEFYTFTPSATEANDRIELILKPSLTTDVDEETTSVSSQNVNIYAVKQEATVKVTDEVLAKSDRLIEVYDISGQLVKKVELNNAETIINLPQANAMYIINVTADGDSYQQKVVAQN